MLARAHTFTVEGLHMRRVTVEVDVRPGLPAFTIVGLADTAVREARDRVRAAILNSGFDFPARRITASLAPGDLPKAGAGLDLALACALLAATGQLGSQLLDDHALVGELALDGRLRACRGGLATAIATRRERLSAIVLARADAAEAALVQDVRVATVDSLQSAVRVLAGGAPDGVGEASPANLPSSSRRCAARRPCELAGRDRPEPDLIDVRGQHHAIRALLIAAAGGHNLLLYGPPGTGKTMLARRLSSILPPLTRAEALDVARVRSAAGEAVAELPSRPPFRAPHHSVTAAGLLGGAACGSIGEAALAHRGVLFLDELSEYARPAVQALREPLEDRRVALARAGRSIAYDAAFMLVAATNPCPCGYAGDGDRCRCSNSELARHRQRLSGPLLDRIDLVATLEPERVDGVLAPPLTSSREARGKVVQARERQARRLPVLGVALNAHLDARATATCARLDRAGREMLRGAARSGMLSMRGQQRVLRVARTIADLAGEGGVSARHLGMALSLRPEAVLGDRAP